MRDITTFDALESAMIAGVPIDYGTDLMERNRSLTVAFEEGENRSAPQKFEFMSTQFKGFLASLSSFTGSAFLTKAISPTHFKEGAMPISLNVSTGLSAFLKLYETLEKNGCSLLSKKISDHLVKASYMILMYGLNSMETGAISDFIDNMSVINTIGLFAVTGFTLFSGMKFPGVTYTPKQNFIIEFGLTASSLGFLLKNMIAGIDAKQDNNMPAWSAALYLMFASIGFILATAYEAHKAWVVWSALTATEHSEEHPEIERQPSAHVALSAFSEIHNRQENAVVPSQTITPTA